MPRKNKVQCICPICKKVYYTLRPRVPNRTCSKTCAIILRKNNYLYKYGKITHNRGNNREKAKETCIKKYGVENPSQIPIVKHKKVETAKLHYGVEHPSKTAKIKEKMKRTNLEKYGKEYASQSEIIKAKIKATNLKRYNTESHNSAPEVKQRKVQSCLEKYGKEYFFQTEEAKNKIKRANFEKYGVENAAQAPEIIKKIKKSKKIRYGNENYNNRDKSKKTCIEKYGCEYYMQSNTAKSNMKEYIEKSYLTKKANGHCISSKLEEKVFNKLCQKFSNVQRQYRTIDYPFACDFYIEDVDIYIEIQGHWTHGKKPYLGTEKDIKKLEIWKKKARTSIFYQQAIRVWTETDVEKRKVAKLKNLKWFEFFTMEEFEKWYTQM